MTFVDALRTLFEIVTVVALIWCVFNEQRLIAFEKRFVANIRRKRLRVVRNNYPIRNS